MGELIDIKTGRVISEEHQAFGEALLEMSSLEIFELALRIEDEYAQAQCQADVTGENPENLQRIKNDRHMIFNHLDGAGLYAVLCYRPEMSSPLDKPIA
jgi:hypothetical protein